MLSNKKIMLFLFPTHIEKEIKRRTLLLT
ncbi:hypothetical protein LINPERPRIM_LOCUS13774 [Linum perenne]